MKRYCLGVDLGGTNIAVGLVDADAVSIVRKMSTKTNAPRPCEDISADIRSLSLAICREEGIDLSSVLWVGVAAPGIVKDGVIIAAYNLGWDNVDFKRILGDMMGIPTYIANDANSAAYAELKWGVGKGESSLIAVTLGTGVGGGIVFDGKIWEGINGFAAEVGHMVIEADGRVCGCGQRGCIEAYCSATALISEASRAARLYPASTLRRMMDANGGKMSGVIPFAAAREGDFAAKRVVDDFVHYLAVGIANLINLFQPAVVCIGGGISGEGDNLLNPVLDYLSGIAFGVDGYRTRVEICKFRNDAGIIGAASLGLTEE